MTGKRVKDFYRFVRSVGSFTDGQVCVLDWDEEKLEEIRVQIQPNDGAYEGGRFVFTIKMPNDFPESSPEVNCDTDIYHPNIDPTGDSYNVCLSLFDEWTSSFGMQDIIQGLLFLFYEPNVEDALSSYFGDVPNEEEFHENVRASLRGEDVEDYSFPWNYHGNDPEMLQYKPKIVGKVKESGSAKETANEENAEDTTEENCKEPEVNNNGEKIDEHTKEIVNTETTEQDNAGAAEENEIITTSNAEEEAATTSNVEDVQNTENTREESDQAKDECITRTDIEIVNDNNQAQDLTVILEKVSAMILQYPDEDEEKQTETETRTEDDTENTTEPSTETAEPNNPETNVEETDPTATEINGASENTAAQYEVTTDTTSAGSALQRQSSKIERQCSVTEITEELSTTTSIQTGRTTEPFSYYIDEFRDSPFVPPDLDFTVNVIGAACYYMFKSYVT